METNATTGAAFAINIGAWCKKAKKDLNKAGRALVFEIFKRVIMRTPVDTGAARGNWQVGINQMPTGKVAGADAQASFSGLNVLEGQEVIGNIIFLVNNLPYIGVLEYGGYPNPPKQGSYIKGQGYTIKSSGGFSKQAPAGMVRVTVQEISDAVDTALRKK